MVLVVTMAVTVVAVVSVRVFAWQVGGPASPGMGTPGSAKARLVAVPAEGSACTFAQQQ